MKLQESSYVPGHGNSTNGLLNGPVAHSIPRGSSSQW